MVRWFDPHQLIDTAVRVLLSGVFSSYADSREQQAREPAEVPDRSRQPELWLDYVADLGDGWNSTYTIASLLATEGLDIEREGETHRTERGQLLVFGGDAVYPVPKAREYENRMLGPYRSALPCAGGEAPELFAIPGSHDWYDGLVNFTSIFCRSRWIGGWKTNQRRSYFAIKLPHGWWLWGIDIQFGAQIDEVQLRYFADVAADQMQRGDRVILCMAKEVESGRKGDEVHSDRDVGYLEREIIQPSGAQLLLYFKSGKHYYSRYEEIDGPRHHIESGGGGAFLHPTHNLPEHADHPGPDGPAAYRRAHTYPTAAFSKGLRKRIWLMPAYNIPLAAVFGTVQVLLAFMLGLHLEDRYVSLGVGDLLQAMWESPTAFLLSLLVLASLVGMVRFAHDASGIGRILLGLVHSSLQVASVSGVMIAASYLSAGLAPEGVPLPTRLPGSGLAAGRRLRHGGNGRVSLGDRLPGPAQHRGLRSAAPPRPEALSAAAHPGRRLAHDLPHRHRARGPQVGAAPRRSRSCPLVRPRGPGAPATPHRSTDQVLSARGRATPLAAAGACDPALR